MDLANSPVDSIDYLSASTLAPPSPSETEHQTAMATSQVTPKHKRELSSAPVQPYATIGKLSYAPATQTTVVTTTTTTTTSFPPLLLKEPRHLHDRDPKQYPLAASPTPASIRNFCFDIAGESTCFEETDDLEGSLLQFNQKHTSLQANNGTIRSITSSGTQYETPKKFAEQHLSGNKATGSRVPTTSVIPKKRSTSPVSLAEAAELASLQRRNKKLRTAFIKDEAETPELYNDRAPKSRLSQSFDDSTPVTPDTDAGSTGQFKIPKNRSRTKRSTAKSLLQHGAEPEGHLPAQGSSRHHSFGRSGHWTGKKTPLGTTKLPVDDSEIPSFTDRPVSGISATPPIVESDLELVVPIESPVENVPQQRRPTPLDTLSAQDASLPSPSLSPITAAANQNGPTLEGLADEDNADDVSSLDISQDSFRGRIKTENENVSSQLSPLDVSISLSASKNGSAKAPAPTLMDIPAMLDSFDAMPTELQTYVMYQMLRRCAKPTLHVVADVVNPALKCDFLALLPLELSMNIIKYFDIKTMCRAAQVSKKWRQIIDSDEKAWKTLLDTDGFVLPNGEVERAVKEGWGWQSPYGRDNCEKDLSARFGFKSDGEVSSPTSSSYMDSEYSTPATSSRPKRKAAGKHSSHTNNKKRKIKATSSKSRAAPWLRSLEAAQGPIAHANAAALAVPNPDVGLSTLRNLHLYKSIYRRHHAIKKSWMEEDVQPHHLAFKAHGRHVVTCLQFDSDKIITGSDDTRIHIYDTKTGREIKRLSGHEGGVWALQYDGNILVSGSTDRSVRVWDIEKGKCIQQFQGHTSTVRCLVILKPTKIGEEADGTPIIMPKEPLIITGSRDSSLRVWKLPLPGERSVFQNGPVSHDSENPYFIRALTGHHHSVRAIAAHGDTLVSGSYDSSVRVWKISTGDLMHRLSGHTAKVYSVVLDPERNRCISGSMDNTVRVWSLETGNQLYHLDGHTSLVGLLDLSYSRLVSAAADSTLRIWDPETGQCKSTLTAHTGAITCFQHDDQKVISGSDRTLKLWNVKTGDCVKDLLTDLSGVWQVKFNERRCVAAVQRDNLTYIEVLDFGAARDGVDQRGVRIVVDRAGHETDDSTDTDEANIL